MNKLPEIKEIIILSDGNEIKLTRPKVAAMRIAEKKTTEADRMICLIGICTNMTEAQIGELELIDYAEVQKEVNSFLVASGFAAPA